MTNKEAQDCISRADAVVAIQNEAIRLKKNADTVNGLYTAVTILYDMPSVTPQELIHRKCNQCKYYEGVHDVQGHAPCSYHNIGGVMWDWYCSQFDREIQDRE